MKSLKQYTNKLYQNILVAISLLFTVIIYECPNVAAYETQADWNKIDNLIDKHGALDVKTPRVLSYKLTTTFPTGKETVITFDAEIANDTIKIPINPFLELDTDNVIGEFLIDARGLVTHPTDEKSLIPSVVMLFDSMPDALINIGTTWERQRPTNAQAVARQSIVIQSRRKYEVTTAWNTPDGIVIRVYVRGFTRLFPNDYFTTIANKFGLSTDEIPEHYGYVDVNINTGTVIDALFYVEFLSNAKIPEEIPHQKGVKILRLCPKFGSYFYANEDTCL